MNRAERRRRRKIERRSHPSLLHRAIAHHQAGRLQQAEDMYRQVLAADPEDIDACHLLGVIAYQTGRNDLAIELISRALKKDPGQPHFHNNLGNALYGLGSLDEAREAYQKAVNIRPGFAEAHQNLGNVFSRQGRLDEALESYHRAIRIRPDYPEAHNHLGNVLAEQGRKDEAAASFQRAIDCRPGYAEAYRHLAQVRRHSRHDPIIVDMLTAYQDPRAGDDQRMHLAFGLGKVFEDLEDFEKSFDFIMEGNRLKRSSYDYDPERDREFFRDLKGVFTDDFFREHLGSGPGDGTPIFIVGMMRSGSSLVEQILASHPEVHGAGELSDFERTVIGPCEMLTGARFPHGLDRLGAGDLQRLGHDYLGSIRRHSRDAGHITDKMLYNFMYIGMIKLVLPEARIIHCRRDPVDTCLSIFKNYFTGFHEYAYDLEELGGYYNFYQEWMEYLEGLLPGQIFTIEYEDIIADQEGETRRMLEYCGLPWDEACLSFHRTARPVRTASSEQVKRPIYNSSVGLWRRYEKRLGPLLETLRQSD